MKITRFTRYILGILLIVPQCLLAEKNEGKTSIQNCTGASSACEQTVNAIGDKISLSIPAHQIMNLGMITVDKEVSVRLPKDPGSQTAYSFVPSSGESAGELVTVFFDNKKQRPGTRLFGKGEVKMYRRFTTDPSATWVEIGNIEFPMPLSQLTPEERTIKVILKPDGTAVYTSPVTKRSTIFLAGTKDLSEAAEKERAEMALLKPQVS